MKWVYNQNKWLWATEIDTQTLVAIISKVLHLFLFNIMENRATRLSLDDCKSLINLNSLFEWCAIYIKVTFQPSSSFRALCSDWIMLRMVFRVRINKNERYKKNSNWIENHYAVWASKSQWNLLFEAKDCACMVFRSQANIRFIFVALMKFIQI